MSIQKVDKTTGDTSLIAGSTLYADSPIGTILPYGGASAPSGWFLCDGTAVSRTTYSELFAVIGESFGAGDGSTTFNIPDMRGKFAEGTPSNGTLGESKNAGLPNITGELNTELQGKSYYGTRSPSGALDSRSTVNVDIPQNSGTTSAGQGLSFDASKSNSIYGNSDTVQPPAVCVNYIIKAKMVAVPADFLAKVDETLNTNILVSPVQVSAIHTQYELNLNTELKTVNKLMVSFYTDIGKSGTDIRYYPFIIYLNEAHSSAADTKERRNNSQLSVEMGKRTSTKLALTIFAGQLYTQDSYYVDGVYII